MLLAYSCLLPTVITVHCILSRLSIITAVYPADASTMMYREDLDEAFDSFDEGVYCRSRSWLFLAYLVSFGSIMAAVAVLLKDYALNDAVDGVWPGVAGLFQVTLILGSGLLLFVSRTPTEGGGSASYGAF